MHHKQQQHMAGKWHMHQVIVLFNAAFFNAAFCQPDDMTGTSSGAACWGKGG
jgi:hypothetical protein